MLKLLADGEHTIPELAELFSVSRATVYRVIQRAERAQLAQRLAMDTAGRPRRRQSPAGCRIMLNVDRYEEETPGIWCTPAFVVPPLSHHWPSMLMIT